LTVTHQPFELKSCSNPLQMGKVLQFRIKKKFSVGCLHFWWCLRKHRIFWHVFPSLSKHMLTSKSRGSLTIEQISWLKTLLDLIGFYVILHAILGF